MEGFEQKVLSTLLTEPLVDDTFAIWKYGKEKLNESLEHLTTVNANIKLTVKKEANNLQEISDTKFTRSPHIQTDIFSMSTESRHKDSSEKN